MDQATRNHSAATAAPARKTPSAPQWRKASPPSAPPTKAPRNWLLEKAPMAEPLACGGAMRETSDGNVASSTLKAAK